MGEEQIKLTVFFEEPFWVGIFERLENNRLSVSKITFGAEPKDYEIYAFILKHFDDLKFSPAVTTAVKEISKNPKKMHREIQKALLKNGVGTKSQQALKLQQEENKQERQVKSREKKLAEAKRLFELKQQKRKRSIGADNAPCILVQIKRKSS